MNKLKNVFQALLILFLVFLLWYGVKLGDFTETRNNGSALCLSCIGIQ